MRISARADHWVIGEQTIYNDQIVACGSTFFFFSSRIEPWAILYENYYDFKTFATGIARKKNGI